MMKRRTFLRTGSAGLIAGMLLPERILANLTAPNQIGLQLYSVRDEMAKDPEACLKRISGIGYTRLEAAGYEDRQFYGMPPGDFRQLVEELGMRLVASHVSFNKDNMDKVLEAHREAGIKYLVWPWLSQEQRSDLGSYRDIAVKCNAIGKMCKDNNMKFGYHNHDFEFQEMEGKIPYDVLLDETDPELVCMEIDLYWITFAGKDPKKYFEKYPGRFHLWHVKDMAGDGSRDMTEVGSGMIDYKELFGMASVSGMKEFFVEQDTIKGNVFESVQASYNYINSIL
ncbi:MAG: sugar phosphate isomerase/epimerase [Bacteroidales bacterium]|jgi:sugar phosphate isomerase/epimerase|nr:sugar phosphate isomerase/epimerase [Bacteroidales bacterium]